jgi:hypothetical protein
VFGTEDAETVMKRSPGLCLRRVSVDGKRWEVRSSGVERERALINLIASGPVGLGPRGRGGVLCGGSG